MGKKIVYTKITPLPSNVPRQLALDLLHSHEEMIKMNPLVTGVRSIETPRNAGNDEYFSNWYEITEIITWGFGLKKKISFNGCFHDQPWGMQSHIFAPMNTDMRQTYRIGGNQPGEPRETRELGVDTPMDGLYLREDVNITCQVPLTAGFIKKEMKEASSAMIERLRRKAELLDEGKLHAMFEDGKLKTAKPTGAPTFDQPPMPSPGVTASPCGSGSPAPVFSPDSRYSYQAQHSPALDQKGFGRYHDVARAESVRSSVYTPHYQQQGYQGPQYTQTGAELPGPEQKSFAFELPGSYYQPQQQNSLYPQPLKPQGQSFRAELLADTEYMQQRPVSQISSQTGSVSTPATQYSNMSPPAQYQAYNRSPQPSPGLPSQQSMPSRDSSNGGYQVTNPGGPQPSPGLPSPQNIPSRDSSNSGYQITNLGAPQPSPRLPSQQNMPSRDSLNNGYQIANPDGPPQPNGRNSQGFSVQEWQRSVQNDQPIDGSYYRNSRPPDSAVEPPDHHRFSNLSIQQNANDAPAQRSQTCKCP